MNQVTVLTHKFVEFIPDNLEDETIYVSMVYATVAHKCCCGCGSEVITPLSPIDWKLIFDGETVSLEPSIGNWNFACQSHYWIKRNKVRWAPRWTRSEIDTGRAYDALSKKRYFADTNMPISQKATESVTALGKEGKSSISLWQKLKKWLVL